MFLAERLELDLANRGNRLIGWIGAVLNVPARYIPEYPPPIPMGRKNPSKPNRPRGFVARRYLWSVKMGGATGWFGIRREFAAGYLSVVRPRSALAAQRTDIDHERWSWFRGISNWT